MVGENAQQACRQLLSILGYQVIFLGKKQQQQQRQQQLQQQQQQ
jgi:hypothetical protein